jgi:hypothetical protein
VVESGENSNEPSGSIKDGDQLSEYQLLKGSALCN